MSRIGADISLFGTSFDVGMYQLTVKLHQCKLRLDYKCSFHGEPDDFDTACQCVSRANAIICKDEEQE
jgi:hypothetical protein